MKQAGPLGQKAYAQPKKWKEGHTRDSSARMEFIS